MTAKQALEIAMSTWAANACYLDRNGNYRIKDTGRIAAWSRTVKTLVTCDQLHLIAKAA